MQERGYWPHRGDEDMQVRTVTPAEGALYRRCEALEYAVFLAAGYVAENPAGRIDALDRYPHQAMLAALTGDRQRPGEERPLAGVMRVIHAPRARTMGPGLFPTVDHARELRIAPEKLARVMAVDPRRCIDVATMAIAGGQRDGRASRALITEIMRDVWGRPPLRYALAAIDTPFYGKLKARGLPFEALGPSVPYWGSPSTATFADSYQVLKGFGKLVIAGHVLRGLGRWGR